jgi:hypothetical protein
LALPTIPQGVVSSKYIFIFQFSQSTHLSLENVNRDESYGTARAGKQHVREWALIFLVAAHVAFLRLSGTTLVIEVVKFQQTIEITPLTQYSSIPLFHYSNCAKKVHASIANLKFGCGFAALGTLCVPL